MHINILHKNIFSTFFVVCSAKKAQKQRSHIKAPLVFRFLSLYNGYIRGSAVRQAAAGMAPAAMKKQKREEDFMNSFTSAVKSIAKKYNDTSLILRIAIGLVIGAVLALLCPGATWLEELGNLFVGALKGVAPVLVFVIVTSALAQGSSKLDRRFGTVVWLYMLTTFIAATLSVITSMLFPQNLVLAEAATADVIPQGLGDVLHTLLANIVSNPLSAIMNGNYIGILM